MISRARRLLSILEDTVYTKEGLNGTFGLVRADSDAYGNTYYEAQILRGDTKLDGKTFQDQEVAIKWLDSQWDKYESNGINPLQMIDMDEPTGVVKSYAQQSGKSVADVEAIWNKYKQVALDKGKKPTDPSYWSFVSGMTKKELGLK